ncbi:enoyl-CoA hydratase/isomerase family protein [Chloroflexi bacterium TSY]|nr:enoyl-CoA hydratase/isomerase family protein [Chloroflexi bacterium TSY]
MNFDTLTIEINGSIGTLTLNRPERMNALSPKILRDLADAARWFDTQTDIRVVIIQGAGRAFSAGADLKEPSVLPVEGTNWIERRERAQLGRRMAEAIEGMRAVTIAQVHGYAIGGGVVLMSACDLRVVAEDTVIFIPEVDLGIPLAWGGIPRLVSAVGPALTKEWVMTCRHISPQEAKEAGFVNRVVSLEQLPTTCRQLADKIAAKPSVPIVITKEHINSVARAMSAGSTSFADGDSLLAAVADPASAEERQAYVNRTIGRKSD